MQGKDGNGDRGTSLDYCDRLILMKEGNLFASGKTAEVASEENLRAVYGIGFEETVTASGRRYLVPLFPRDALTASR